MSVVTYGSDESMQTGQKHVQAKKEGCEDAGRPVSNTTDSAGTEPDRQKADLGNTGPLNWVGPKEQQPLDQKSGCHFRVRKERGEVPAAKTGPRQGVG